MIAIRRYGCHHYTDLSIDAPLLECTVACGVRDSVCRQQATVSLASPARLL